MGPSLQGHRAESHLDSRFVRQQRFVDGNRKDAARRRKGKT